MTSPVRASGIPTQPTTHNVVTSTTIDGKPTSGMFEANTMHPTKTIGRTPSQLLEQFQIEPALLEVAQFSTISYAGAPNTPATELTYEEYTERFHSVYSETLHGTQDLAVATTVALGCARQLGSLYKELQAQVAERINNPLDAFIVTDMGQCGAGLFAKQDIPKRTVLFLYSGQIVPKPRPTEQTKSEYLLGMTANTLMDAEKVGGLARFMLHLPSERPTPERVRIAQAFRQNRHNLQDLAVGNVIPGQFMVNNVLVNAWIASTDINKGDMIGFDYGEEFISNMRARNQAIAYFSKQGVKIAQI